MPRTTTVPFDVADHLDIAEVVAAYPDAILEEDDDKPLPAAFRHVVSSKGFANVACVGEGKTASLVNRGVSVSGIVSRCGYPFWERWFLHQAVKFAYRHVE